jgi:hypothetical protein
MRENGLNARRRRVFIRTAGSKHALPVFENILFCEFHAEKSGQRNGFPAWEPLKPAPPPWIWRLKIGGLKAA